MKPVNLALMAALALTAVACQSVPAPAETPTAAPNRNLIISYSGEPAPLLATIRRDGGVVVHQLNTIRAIVVRIPDGRALDAAARDYRALPGVLNVERDQIATTQQP